MRLLTLNSHDELVLTKDEPTPPAAYAILSHTWGADDDEVTFDDIEKKTGKSKAGYAKLWFCVNQAKIDELQYCWVDTCCINKANNTELSEAVVSMFHWYQGAARCYAYLSDVSVGGDIQQVIHHTWEDAFRASRWFTRGWTLQELLAPVSVEFFSVEGQFLGTKQTLEGLIHSITRLPVTALRGAPLSIFTVDERFRWAKGRVTKKVEDQAYCLLGIFNVFMPLIYGEGNHAQDRLREEIERKTGKKTAGTRESDFREQTTITSTQPAPEPLPLGLTRKPTSWKEELHNRYPLGPPQWYHHLERHASENGFRNWDKGSVVDLLKTLRLDSSFDARAKLADQLEVHEAELGSSEQNTVLYNKIMIVLLANDGKVQ